MPENFVYDCKPDLTYYGKSDFLAQLTQEIACNPDSCLAQNLNAWYNSLYSELSDFVDCRYQVEINEALCPTVDTEEGLANVLSQLALGDVQGAIVNYLVSQTVVQGRREGRRTINQIERQVRRGLRQGTSPGT